MSILPSKAAEGLSTPTEGHSSCLSCHSKNIEVFYRMDSVPVNSCLLLDTMESALAYPTGRIALAFCRDCGFIGNVLFDPALTRYSAGYEEQQSFSPRFNAFAKELAERLIARHGLRGKTILEIGCGKGDFLALLCELGPNRGIGIDPTYIPGRLEEDSMKAIRFIQDFYSPKYSHLDADFVCCRHTLEHIPTTAEFMLTVRQAIGDREKTVVFFELPDVARVLKESAFWDIYYEHCSYFSLGSLARLFANTGFEVLDLSTVYDGQYLLLEARPASGASNKVPKEADDLQELSAAVAQFQKSHEALVTHWKQRLRDLRNAGRRVAIWGAGSKCVAFLTTLGIQDEHDVVVDINPHRQEKYLPRSGKRIFAPTHLTEYRPDVVVVMNPIYAEEIRRELNSMALTPEIIAV